jgi:hypothetical protein
LQLLTALKASSNSEEKYSVVPIWVFRNLPTPQTVDPSQKNRRKITVLRFQELYTFFYRFFPVFRKYMVQKFPVIAKVKHLFYFMQVVEEISDNKPHLTPFFCAFSVAISIAVGELSTLITSNP